MPFGWIMVFFSGCFETYLIWDLCGIGLALGVVFCSALFDALKVFKGLVSLVFL